MLYFLEKARKIAGALGAPLPNPRLPLTTGGLLPDPQIVISTQFKYYFRALRRFLGIVKIKITTYYPVMGKTLASLIVNPLMLLPNFLTSLG